MTETKLDLRGLKCPLPALRVRKALGRMQPGEVVLVECTDPLSVIDIPHLIGDTKDALLDKREVDGLFLFQIRREAR